MPNEPMERIDIEVTAKTEDAAKGLQSLNRALNRLKKITDGLSNLSGIKNLDNLSAAVRRFTNSAGGEFKDAVSSLRSLTKIDLSKFDPEGISKIGDAADSLDSGAADKLSRYASAIREVVAASTGAAVKEAISNLSRLTSSKSVSGLSSFKVPSAPLTAPSTPSELSGTTFIPSSEVKDTTEKLHEMTESLRKAQGETARAGSVAKEAATTAGNGFRSFFGILGKAAKGTAGVLAGIGTTALKVGSQVASGIGRIATAPFRKFASVVQNAAAKVGSFFSSIKRILFYRAIRTVLSEISKGIKEGIDNFYQYSKAMNGAFAGAMDTLATSKAYLDNSLGAALAPLIEAAAPVIDFLVDKLVDLINELNKLFALFSGADHWTRAIKQEKEYAEAAEEAKDAQEELKRTVMGFDELNLLRDEGSADDESKEADKPEYAFEDVPFDGTSTAEKIKDAIDKIKDFLAPLWDWIKDALSKLWDWLKDLWSKLKDFWDAYGPEIIAKIKDALSALWDWIKSVAQSIWDVFKAAWDKVGPGLIESIKKAFQEVWELIKAIGRSIAEVFNNGTGQRTFELLLSILKDIFDIIGNFARKFREAWEEAGTGTRIIQAWWNIFNDILELIHRILSATADWLDTLDFSPILQGFADVSEAFEGLVKTLCDLTARIYEEVVLPIAKWVIEELAPAFEKTLAAAIRMVTELIGPLVEGALGAWQEIQPIIEWVEGVVIMVFDKVRDVFNRLAETFKEKGDKIREILTGIGEIVEEVWEWIWPIFELAKEQVGDTLEFIGKLIDDVVRLIIDTLHGLVEFIAGVLTGDWERAWNGLKEIVDATWQNIKDVWTHVFEWIKAGWDDTKEYLINTWSTIKEKASEWWNNTKETIGKVTDDIHDKITGTWDKITNWMTEKTDKLKQKVSDGWENIKKTIHDALEKIKGFFNFEWSLPHLKLPHFSLSGSFSLDPPSVPKLSVDWYKNGGFPEAGQLFMAREAGPELVGSIGGKTAVANNDQIVEGIAYGVRDANEDIVNALYAVAQQIIQTVRDKDTSAYIDGRKISREVTSAQNRDNRMYGPARSNA